MPDGEYMFHSYSNFWNKADIYWGHYDLTIAEALQVWSDKIKQNPTWAKTINYYVMYLLASKFLRTS